MFLLSYVANRVVGADYMRQHGDFQLRKSHAATCSAAGVCNLAMGLMSKLLNVCVVLWVVL